MSGEKCNKESCNHVTISRQEYEELLKDSAWLRCLEAAGVDNWEGYDIAVDMFDENGEEEGV